MKNKNGRPTKYRPEMPELVLEYMVDNNFPTIEGFATHVGVDRDTIYEWQKHNKKFSYTIKRLLTAQSVSLQKGGIEETFNTTMAIFLLKNNHGFKDRNETDITSGGKPIPILGGVSKNENKGTDKEIQ